MHSQTQLPQPGQCYCYIMKKTTAFSSLLLFGGLGSLSYFAAQLADLNLTFNLRGEDVSHYC